MGRADLHIHTSYSDGMASAREILDWTEERTSVDVIAITDHDDVTGSLRAREVWARGRYRFDLVPGAEITTIEGHLLALFVEEPLPSLCRLEEAVEAVQRQGGVCVVPHPMNPFTRSLSSQHLRGTRGLHGIELANCSPGSGLRRRAAGAIGRRLGLARIGGSDAHFPDFIGAAYTEFEGTTAAQLKAAILAGSTRARRGKAPSLLQIGPHRLLHQTYRGIMTTPRRMGWGPTARSFVRRLGLSR